MPWHGPRCNALFHELCERKEVERKKIKRTKKNGAKLRRCLARLQISSEQDSNNDIDMT